MKTAWRKLLRIKQIYNPNKLFKQEKDMKTKFSIRTNNISSKFHLSVLKKSNYIGVVQFPLFFNMSDGQVSMSFKDGHIAAEIKKQQMYLYLKTSAIGRTRLRIKPDNLAVQATLPAKYGEMTADFNFGPHPVLGLSYNFSKFNNKFMKNTYLGAVSSQNPQLFLYTNLPSFSFGVIFSYVHQYIAWRWNNKRVCYTGELQHAENSEIKLVQQTDFHYYYGDLHLYLSSARQGFSGGFTLFPLKILGKESQPTISTSFIMHTNLDMYTFVSAQITPSFEVCYIRYQPSIGPGRSCLDFRIDFRNPTKQLKEIDIDE